MELCHDISDITARGSIGSWRNLTRWIDPVAGSIGNVLQRFSRVSILPAESADQKAPKGSRVTQPAVVTLLSYDYLGNLTRILRAKDDSTYERAVDYTYDGLNRVRAEM